MGAYYGGSWQEIPADAILRDELNRVPLHAHICERTGFVYCFLRGLFRLYGTPGA